MRNKKIFGIILGICLLLICNLADIPAPVFAEELNPMVTFSMEKLTIGQGYLIQPVQIPIQEGETVAQLVMDTLGRAGYSYTNKGNATSDFYLQSVENADNGVLEIPSVISELPAINGISAPSNEANEGNSIFPALGEYSYSKASGWMYSVNGEFSGMAMSDYSLKAGDVVRVQFSVYGYGNDVNGKEIALADKQQLTQLVAECSGQLEQWNQAEGFTDTWQWALQVLETFDVPQQQVEDAYNQLLLTMAGGLEVPFTEITLSKSEISMYLGDDIKTLSVKSFSPVQATMEKKVSWNVEPEGIVSLDPTDNTVSLQGISEGFAIVTATTENGVCASCEVTVVENVLTPTPTVTPDQTTANKLKPSLQIMMERTKDWILSQDTNPDTTSQWNVIGLSRSGLDVPADYYNTFYQNAVNELTALDGELSKTTYTAYSKMILSMTSIGKDARKIGGYNLFKGLADFENVKKQGINGPAWALIAVNCNPSYQFVKVSGVKTQTTEKRILQYLLRREIAGGGWSLTGDEPDVDVTGMVLTALAPYYNQKNHGNVTKAIDRGIKILSEKQDKETGGYASYGVSNPESTVQVIVALTALGINPKTDSRFIKNGNWLLSDLQRYYVSSGGFRHVLNGKPNGMATEQGCYAMTAYWRLTKNQTSLFDLSEMKLEEGAKGQVVSGTGKITNNASGSNQTKHLTSATTKRASSGATKKVSTEISKAASQTTEKSKKNKSKQGSGWSFGGDSFSQEDSGWEDSTMEAFQEDTDTMKAYSGEDTKSVLSAQTVRKDTKKRDRWALILTLGGLGLVAAIYYPWLLKKERKKTNHEKKDN